MPAPSVSRAPAPHVLFQAQLPVHRNNRWAPPSLMPGHASCCQDGPRRSSRLRAQGPTPSLSHGTRAPQLFDAVPQWARRRRDGTTGLVGGSVGLLRASRTLPHPTEAVGGKKIILCTSGMAAMAAATSAALQVTETWWRGSFSRPNRPYRLTWNVLAAPVTNFRGGVRSAVKSAVKLAGLGS
jgi:hypothetical protein